MRTWIKNPLAILASDADGGIVVENGQIVQLLAAGQSPTPRDNPLQIVDASAHVVLPGLINTHHHFYQTLTRACPPALNKPLFPWLQALYPIWAGLNPKIDRVVDTTGTGRIVALRVYNDGGSSLFVSGQLNRCHRYTSRRSQKDATACDAYARFHEFG